MTLRNDLDDYQEKASRTAAYPDIGSNLYYPTLGLAGEAGEVANKVKKIYRDQDGYIYQSDTAGLMDELGDVLWYVAAIASELELSLSSIAERNIDKLSSRSERDKVGGSGDNR